MDLTGWFSGTITLAKLTGMSGTGTPTYGAQSSVAARVEPHVEMVRGKDGNLVASTHRIATQSAVGIEDQIWLSTDSSSDNGVVKKPISIQQATDKPGATVYWEILVK